MADQQVGNVIGVTAVGPADGKIAEITADGTNTFTVAVADVSDFRIGMQIIFRVKASGIGFGTTARTVTGITAAGVVTYDGADVALVPGTHAVYTSGVPYATTGTGGAGKVNLNGGPTPQEGFGGPEYDSIQAMKDRLFAISPTTFTQARMNTMTENDLRYAVRVMDDPASVK